MEYTFHTVYDRKAMKALAKGLRKTLRARRNRRSRIMGTLVVLLGMLLIWSQKTVDIRSIITAAAMLAVSMYFASGGDSVKSWSAGQVSVTGGASWQDLRDRAEMLMAGYIDAGSGFDFRGVMG